MTDNVVIPKTEVLKDAKELMQEMMDLDQRNIYLTSNVSLQERNPDFYKGILDDEERIAVEESLIKIFSNFDSTDDAAVDATIMNIEGCNKSLALQLCINVFYRGNSVLFFFPRYMTFDDYISGYVCVRRLGNELQKVGSLGVYEHPEIFFLGKRIVERYLIDC